MNENIYLDLVLANGYDHINFFAKADPTDPIVIKTHAQIEALQTRARWTVGLMTVPVAALTAAMVSAFDAEPLLIWFMTILAMLGMGLLYVVLVQLGTGALCQQAIGEMQWRQAADIRYMRQASQADREQFGGPQ